MRQKLYIGVYVSILTIFIFLCILSVFQLTKSNSFATQINDLKDSSSQVDTMKKKQAVLESQLNNEEQKNSQLSSQLNALESDYNDLKSQVTKIQQTRAETKGKVAYLTFDDGPSNITSSVLDVLKANNVKATFFVVGTSATGYPSLILRASSEGHVIGIHSWTHDYSYIYKNDANFFEDFNKLKVFLTNLIGYEPTVSRYPGGTNNTVSQRYSDHILRTLDPEVKAMGIKPFDWNAYAGDADAGPKPNKDKIIKNVLNGSSSYKSLVILMHDTSVNANDVLALPEIISGLRAEGFTFGTLTPFTPDVQFKPY